ncbi:MAG: hypothetical protein K0R54_6144 [Clostridiaceae bacterium]|nr:hypothetical protein [Clostridiaceae bacterium]
MNLIDFHVTKIISEEKDVVYKLLNITKEQVDKKNCGKTFFLEMV